MGFHVTVVFSLGRKRMLNNAVGSLPTIIEATVARVYE
jgi:hypothetical protein